jgi:hypothetical protein
MGDESVPGDFVTEYSAYLARFEQMVGTAEFGAYVKHHGRLVKKLRYDEFEQRWTEYQNAVEAYTGILERGDTINDIVVKLVRERSDELLIDRTI